MLIALALSISGVPAWAAAGNYFEVLSHGRIDWTNGFLEAYGVGRPPPDPRNAAHARAVAERSADIAARSNLMDLVESIRVDSQTLVRDKLAERAIPREALEEALREARSVGLSYGPDEEVWVTVSIRLKGALAEILLPGDIRNIATVKLPRESGQKEEPYSGLLLDCRGIPLKPGMVPLIVDEDGSVVYGPAFASRDHAVERGMAAYRRGAEEAASHPRVGPNPLSVRGIRTVEGRPSDIMISHADAAKIRGLASNLDFLQQCRVLLLVD